MSDIGEVYFNGKKAGVIFKENDEFVFIYDETYLKSDNPRPISTSLPLTIKPYRRKRFFPFFDGLLSEGWLKKTQSKNQKIDSKNKLQFLLNNAEDLIGAVTVIRKK